MDLVSFALCFVCSAVVCSQEINRYGRSESGFLSTFTKALLDKSDLQKTPSATNILVSCSPMCGGQFALLRSGLQFPGIIKQRLEGHKRQFRHP